MHGENNNLRSSQCSAYNKKCTKCLRLHHFASVCKSKTQATSKNTTAAAATTVQNSDSDDAEISGFIAALSTVKVTSPAQLAPMLGQLRAINECKDKHFTSPTPCV